MTPDLDAIRAALAAPGRGGYVKAWDEVLVANALTWLASLCDEIERLQEQLNDAIAEVLSLRQERMIYKTAQAIAIEDVVAERDAALAEIERLRAQLEAKS